MVEVKQRKEFHQKCILKNRREQKGWLYFREAIFIEGGLDIVLKMVLEYFLLSDGVYSSKVARLQIYIPKLYYKQTSMQIHF